METTSWFMGFVPSFPAENPAQVLHRALQIASKSSQGWLAGGEPPKRGLEFGNALKETFQDADSFLYVVIWRGHDGSPELQA